MEKLNGKLYINRLCAAAEPKLRFNGTTREEFDKWKENTLAEIKKILKFDKLILAPFKCEKQQSANKLKSPNGCVYKRELWYVDTLEGLSAPVFVMIPENGNQKPALALHCHGADGKNGLVGIVHNDITDNEKKFTFSYAFDMLEKGYTVFCPDILGSGARKPLTLEKPQKSDCSAINNALMSLGYNLLGVTMCELKRVVDFIAEFQNVNMDELVCVGFSSGGLNALWLAALDERIKTVYVSGYFHSLKKTALHSNFCGCNFVPEMWASLDMDTPAMLVAPRKLYIETGRDDNLNGIDGLENVYKLVDMVREVYINIFECENFKFEVCEGKHKWYGVFMDEFYSK